MGGNEPEIIINSLLGDYSLVPWDRLSSQVITTDANGSKISEVRYYPWGGDRYYAFTSTTTFRFTGQRTEFGLGLYYYGARFYDPSAGRFIQADTIIPGAGNPQAWDRYAYTNNNPIKYTDPSGHLSCDAQHVADGDCSDLTIRELISEYNVTIVGDWKPIEVWNLLQAIKAVGTKIVSSMRQTASDAFKSVYNTMEVNMWDGQCTSGCWGWSLGANKIRFYRHYTKTENGNSYIVDTKISEQLIVHELGHSFEASTTPAGGKAPNNYLSTDMTRDRNGLAGPLWTWQQSDQNTPSEIFADMFLGWIYDMWAGTDSEYYELGIDRQNFMNQFMPAWLGNY